MSVGPNSLMPQKHLAFTVRYRGIVDKLNSKAHALNIYSHKRGEFIAIWDTGAMRTVITEKVVQAIKCTQIGVTYMVGVGGDPIRAGVYDIDLRLPNRATLNKIKVASLPKLEGCDILIGMDVINLGDFAVTHDEGNTIMSYSMPPHKKIDFVERSNKLNERNK